MRRTHAVSHHAPVRGPGGVAAAQAGTAESYFGESRGNIATFGWNPPPNEPRVDAASTTYVDELSASTLSLNPDTGGNAYYFVPTPEGETEPPTDVVAQMEAIIASIRELPLIASDE